MRCLSGNCARPLGFGSCLELFRGPGLTVLNIDTRSCQYEDHYDRSVEDADESKQSYAPEYAENNPALG